jgi:hypothetical protein
VATRQHHGSDMAHRRLLAPVAPGGSHFLLRLLLRLQWSRGFRVAAGRRQLQPPAALPLSTLLLLLAFEQPLCRAAWPGTAPPCTLC